MTARLEDAVELLDRSLAYTRVVLAEVTAADLARPTPCTRWRLADLLDHMADSLDAFTDAATGVVPVPPGGPPLGAPHRPGDPAGSGVPGASGASGATARVAGLQQQACALLAAWSGSPPAPLRPVTVGDATIGGPLLVATAALEITVHGWDVARATGADARVPEGLARRLLEVAHVVVGEADRGRRFAPARPAPGPSYADQLPAFLGRG